MKQLKTRKIQLKMLNFIRNLEDFTINSKESLKSLKLIKAVYSDSESKQIIRIPLNIVIQGKKC
ncbi:hypothetical protein [Saccharolobus sp.]|uniref:hypothetical protein n=1 Tax=Saccharolobus sp. TaxID=2100761 RepID=UPI00317353A0